MMKSDILRPGRTVLIAALFMSVLLCGGAAPAAAKIVKCGNATSVCPRKICVEYDKDIMTVGETQRIVITGGTAPYGHSFDQGWQTIELKPESSNSFQVTALRRNANGSGNGSSMPQFFFLDSSRCASGRVEFQVADASSRGNAQRHPLPSVDLNGVWLEQNGHPNSVAILYQEGSDVRMISTYEFQGKRVVWQGLGTLRGTQLTLHYHHTTNTRPMGWEDGTMDLTLSADGNYLKGTARSGSGSWTGNIVFKRSRVRHD